MTDIIKTNHGQIPLFEIIFKDDSVFKGGISYFSTDWMSIKVNKPIRRIFYKLPDNNYICLANYEEYFHMVEGTNDLMGENKGKTIVRFAYIMGKRNNKIESYRITLYESKDSKYKIGDILKREFDINSKFYKGLNKDIWRG